MEDNVSRMSIRDKHKILNTTGKETNLSGKVLGARLELWSIAPVTPVSKFCFAWMQFVRVQCAFPEALRFWAGVIVCWPAFPFLPLEVPRPTSSQNQNQETWQNRIRHKNEVSWIKWPKFTKYHRKITLKPPNHQLSKMFPIFFQKFSKINLFLSDLWNEVRAPSALTCTFCT